MADKDPILEKMQSLIDVWESKKDQRAIFLRCYAMMTSNMLGEIEARRFEDSVWVATLLNHFANYYFFAQEAFERAPGEAPPVWQVAFRAAERAQIHVIQNLTLGVNAHINYDLVFALADLLDPEWASLSEEIRQSRYRDYCHVNEIITHTIDYVQDQIIEPNDAWMGWVDRLMGPVDEWMVARLITDWREQVWENAIQLIRDTDTEQRASLRRRVEQHSLDRAHSILGQQGIIGLIELVE